MNCHENEADHAGHATGAKGHDRGHLGHILMMIACCGLPILIVGLLPLFRNASGGIGDFIARYAFLLCPIMMIPMMLSMRGGKKSKGAAGIYGGLNDQGMANLDRHRE